MVYVVYGAFENGVYSLHPILESLITYLIISQTLVFTSTNL